MSLRVEQVGHLAADQALQVRRLIAATPGAAESPPLSEQAMLRLDTHDGAAHLLAFEAPGKLSSAAESVAGYAQVESGSHAVELVAADGPATVAVAAALVEAARLLVPDGDISLWAHGGLSAARSFAHAAGWRQTRELLQLRRELANLAAPSPPPVGTTIRPFRPVADDAAWLRLNALAFAGHPEQGGWTAADLADRLGSSWFDPAGFFVAERDGELVGFHWTKVHRELRPPVGEVYVLGVHPAAQGQHLGQILLGAGLNHLRERGLGSVLLYVEADNVAAVRLYEKQGFSTFAVDAQYSPA